MGRPVVSAATLAGTFGASVFSGGGGFAGGLDWEKANTPEKIVSATSTARLRRDTSKTPPVNLPHRTASYSLYYSGARRQAGRPGAEGIDGVDANVPDNINET